MRREKNSFKQRIIKYNITMILIVSFILLLYNVLNLMYSLKYEAILTKYDETNAFYKNVSSASFAMQEYIFEEKKEAFQNYNEKVKRAFENLNYLTTKNSLMVTQPFINLENNLIEFNEQANKVVKLYNSKNDLYKIEYSTFSQMNISIGRTRDTYYQLLSDEMNVLKVKIRHEQSYIFWFSFCMFLCLIIWIAWFTYHSITSITNPIQEILKNIKKIKHGEYDLTHISNTSKEMELLCLELDEMSLSVESNILKTQENHVLERKILEFENESLRKDELLIQSELKMLQNQINPHFLFNTLNMIYNMSCYENAVETSEMIICTSHLLRYGLDKQNKLSDLKSEIEAVENYLMIQTRRLGERVEFLLQMDKNVPNIQIPGMIIQPLIENALKHGLQECIEGGEIITKIYCDSTYLYICISDNGKGMDSEELEKMLMNDFENNSEENKLGLYNVVKRIKMFFNEDVDVSINSHIDCGFEFIIKIKLEER